MALPAIIGAVALAYSARTFFAKVLGWMAVTFGVKVLLGMGASYLTFGWLSEWIDGYIDKMRDSVPGTLGPVLDLLAIGGFGVAVNMLGSALIGGAAIYVAVNATRIAIAAAGIAGVADKQRAWWDNIH